MNGTTQASADRHNLLHGQIGAVDKATFVALYGDLFEHSPWVAERAWREGGFVTSGEMISAMMATFLSAERAEQLALLSAHPELAGHEAQAGELTAASEQEQLSAGLDRLSRPEIEEIQALNAQYRKQHGFPFIVCARHYTKEGIFAQLRRRSQRDTEMELEEAFAQVAYIARLRLDLLMLQQ